MYPQALYRDRHGKQIERERQIAEKHFDGQAKNILWTGNIGRALGKETNMDRINPSGRVVCFGSDQSSQTLRTGIEIRAAAERKDDYDFVASAIATDTQE